jgi:tetratricopeptide (TPR) repeat protein
MNGTPEETRRGIPGLKEFIDGARDLSKTPLGLIALFLVFIYLVLTGAAYLFSEQRTIIVGSMLTFVPFVFATFVWLVVSHPDKIYGPSNFQDEAHFLQLIGRRTTIAQGLSVTQEEPGQLAAASMGPSKSLLVGEVQETPLEDEDELSVPRIDWKRRDYERAYFYSLVIKNKKGIDEISSAYLKTPDADQGHNRITWEAFCLSALIRYSKDEDFESLKNLAEARSDIPKVQEYLAVTYLHYEDYESATAIFQRLALESQDTINRERLLARAAVCAAKAGHLDQARQMLEEIKGQSAKSSNGELLNVLKEISEISRDNDTLIAALEQVVEENPADSGARFSLAFKHSECGNHDLALVHYLKILPRDRSGAAWNNLAVEFDHWQLSAQANDAFKKAEELGETLAAANLADKLTNAGFLSEAREKCEAALRVADCNKNVSAALARLQEIPDAENEKLGKIVQNAKGATEFYKHLGKKIILSELTQLAKIWVGPECEFTVSLRDGKFQAVGSQPVKKNALASLGFSSAALGGDMPQTEHVTIEYAGIVKGHTIVGKVKRSSGSVLSSTLLGADLFERPFQAFLSDERSELKVMRGGENNRIVEVWRSLDRMLE